MARSATATATSTTFPTITYPRTGKRGVPQQFPRRLYEMLEKEADQHHVGGDHAGEPLAIVWSQTGRAFRITDVQTFSDKVLPKYFRTSKFSSFQRNLNLYGFTKIRRGPETDMYTHPAFIRGQPETLSQLRKTSSSRRRSSKTTASDDNDSTGTKGESPLFRPVSPSPTREVNSTNFFHPLVQHRVHIAACPTPSQLLSQAWITFNNHQQVFSNQKVAVPKVAAAAAQVVANAKANVSAPNAMATGGAPPSSASMIKSPAAGHGTGRLDLLALALEREGCFAK